MPLLNQCKWCKWYAGDWQCRAHYWCKWCNWWMAGWLVGAHQRPDAEEQVSPSPSLIRLPHSSHHPAADSHRHHFDPNVVCLLFKRIHLASKFAKNTVVPFAPTRFPTLFCPVTELKQKQLHIGNATWQ